MYDQNWKKLSKYFNLELSKVPEDELGTRVFPRETTRVIAQHKGKYYLPEMVFSLTPSWSKTPTVKWATHNARLNRVNAKTNKSEKIYEVPSWKESINKHHCIVPFNKFYESCREKGIAKGHEVSFSDIDSNKTLFGAGIYSRWQGVVNDEKIAINTFALITTEPSDFVENIGHDRMPVFLDIENSLKWMNQDFQDKEKAYCFLQNKSLTPDLNFEKIRKLK